MVDVPASIATAAVIPLGTTTSASSYAGRLERVGDRDWIRVDLVAGQSYNFTLRGGTYIHSGPGHDGVWDTDLVLRNAAGARILTDSPTVFGFDSLLRVTAFATGTYYLDVGTFGGNNGGDYVLTASVGNEKPYGTTTEIRDQLLGSLVNRVSVGSTSVTVKITGLTTEGQTLATRAFNTWASVGGFDFIFVGPNENAKIVIDDANIGLTYSMSWTNQLLDNATMNIGQNIISSWGSGLFSYSQQAFIQMIAIALGLKEGSLVEQPFGRVMGSGYNLFVNDSWQQTVRSTMQPEVETLVTGMSNTWVTGPMMADIAAIQVLYGELVVNRGNTIYGFNTNTGVAAYDFANYIEGQVGAFTINDRDGIDTLNASGFATAQFIDLREGQFSNIGGERGNIGIAYGAVIENAIGGGGNDVIWGNSAANTLQGNAGDDTLMGFLGNDLLYGDAGYDTGRFASGLRSSYALQRQSDGSIVSIGNGDGTDQFFNIERFDFADVNMSTRPYFDFSGDFEADLLLRDTNSGAVTSWNLNNGAFVSSTQIGGMGSNIQIVGSGDFNADGFSDLLLRDLTSGAISDWTVRSGTFNSAVQLGGIGSNIQVVTAADFDRDGGSEILLRNTTSGAVTIWDVSNANSYAGSTQIGIVGGNIQIIGAADFNLDGTDDVLLRDTTSGSVSFWRVNNNAFTSSTQIGGVGSNFNVVGGFDFTGDGNADVLLHDRISGAISYWEVDANGAFVQSTQIGGIGSNFSIIGARDVDGNGFTDVLLRDSTTGGISAFGTNDGVYSQYFNIGGAPGNYVVI